MDQSYWWYIGDIMKNIDHRSIINNGFVFRMICDNCICIEICLSNRIFCRECVNFLLELQDILISYWVVMIYLYQPR